MQFSMKSKYEFGISDLFLISLLSSKLIINIMILMRGHEDLLIELPFLRKMSTLI